MSLLLLLLLLLHKFLTFLHHINILLALLLRSERMTIFLGRSRAAASSRVSPTKTEAAAARFAGDSRTCLNEGVVDRHDEIDNHAEH